MRIVLWSVVVSALLLVLWAEVATPIVQKKHIEPTYQLPIRATVYLEKSITDKEMEHISQATAEWYDVTNGQVAFSIERLPASDIDLTKSVVLLNVTTDYPQVIVLDATNNYTTLAYCDKYAILPHIDFIQSRIDDDEFQAVTMHELGHYLGLDHPNTKEHPERGLGTLMYSSLVYGSNHITQEDLVRFCDLYNCDASKFHGIPQVQ